MRLLIILLIFIVAYLIYRGLTTPTPVLEKPAEVIKPVEKIEAPKGKTALELAAGIAVLAAVLIASAFLL